MQYVPCSYQLQQFLQEMFQDRMYSLTTTDGDWMSCSALSKLWLSTEKGNFKTILVAYGPLFGPRQTV